MDRVRPSEGCDGGSIPLRSTLWVLSMVRQFSAGGVVFKKQGGSSLFLLIQPKPSTDFPKIRFGFPKGLIGPGEKAIDAAIREVREETGITARVLKKLGESKIFYTFKGEKIFKIVTYFLMEYVSGVDAPQPKEIAAIFWLPPNEAKAKLTHANDRKLLDIASTFT